MLGFKDTICLSLFSDPCQYCELINSYQYLKFDIFYLTDMWNVPLGKNKHTLRMKNFGF